MSRRAPHPDNVVDFYLSLPRFAAEAEAQYETFDLNRAEYYRDTANDYARAVYAIGLEMSSTGPAGADHAGGSEGVPDSNRSRAPPRPNSGSDVDGGDNKELCELVDALLVHLLAIRGRFEERISIIIRPRPPTGTDGIVIDSETGTHQHDRRPAQQQNPGRPYKDISPAQVAALWEMGFNWRSIAVIIGVSERTLRNRRHEEAFQQFNVQFSDMTNDELDEHLRSVMSITERSGETFMIGALRSRGIRIQRWRIRESLMRLDPVGRALRRRRVIYRRSYSVPFPNYIWHIDGNHKLIDPWGFVIHGGIDGYSRLCVFLHCSTSNRSQVVLEYFKAAVELYRCPHRVRSDYGTENVGVATYMIEQRGMDRGSFITGKSTHNQRIERLWRDVRECVTSIFSDIFFYMEDAGIADRYNEVHIAAIRYVFLPRVNRALHEFKEQWNNHPLRTASFKSPNMLWYEGMRRNPDVRCDPSVPVDLFDDTDPVPDLQTNNNVQVPELSLQLSEEDRTRLQELVDPLTDDQCRGIQTFLDTVHFISSCIQTPI